MNRACGPRPSAARSPSCRGIFDLDDRRSRLAVLDEQLADTALWDDPRRAGKLSQDAARLRDELTGWEGLQRRAADAREMSGLLDAEPDDALVAEVDRELDALERELSKRETSLLYTDPYSDNAALVTVYAGAGGTDSHDWAEMLLRMYLKWAEEHHMKVEFIDETEGDEAGIKSATIKVEGDKAFGQLRSERGVHRLVRLSPFDSAHRRHTSFAQVELSPEIEDDVELEIDEKDVRIDVYRSSGAGGQHVNKTSSAVRITHLPSGVVVTCQNQRSQLQNRDVAWRVLRSRLLVLKQAAHANKLNELKGDSMPAEWGSQIRSYVLHPYSLVKDHRTGVEVGNAQAVLDGLQLDPFIEGYLRWAATEDREEAQTGAS